MNNNPHQNYNPPPNQPQQNHNQNGSSKVAKTMNATIVTGEYFSKKENRNKKSYLTIGKLFIYHDGGMSLKLDAIPLQGQTISFCDIKPKNQPPQQQQQGYNPQPHQYHNQNNNRGYQERVS